MVYSCVDPLSSSIVDHPSRELFSYLKPESVRVHPEATVRPWATCQVIGDALSFAAALGYVSVSRHQTALQKSNDLLVSLLQPTFADL